MEFSKKKKIKWNFRNLWNETEFVEINCGNGIVETDFWPVVTRSSVEGVSGLGFERHLWTTTLPIGR